MPGGESGRDVLDRYLPLISELRAAHLEDPVGTGEVVVVSHGAAIRLVAAVLAGVHSEFALENHLANTEAVVLVPDSGTGWRCVQWGTHTAPLRARAPDAVPAPVPEGRPAGDPMG
jgi:probable phosphoglycerate mutase